MDEERQTQEGTEHRVTPEDRLQALDFIQGKLTTAMESLTIAAGYLVSFDRVRQVDDHGRHGLIDLVVGAYEDVNEAIEKTYSVL